MILNEREIDLGFEIAKQIDIDDNRPDISDLDISKTEYLGLFPDKEALLSLSLGLSNNGIEPLFELQQNLHLTLSYFGFNGNPDYDKDLLGENVPVKVVGYGEYRNPDTGILENTGLLVYPSFYEIPTVAGQVSDLIPNLDGFVPHITLGINKERNAEGKQIGKAVNTSKCTWKELEKPFYLDLKIGAFSKGEAYFKERK